MTKKVFRGSHTPDGSAAAYAYRAEFDGDAKEVTWSAHVTHNEKRWMLSDKIEDADGLTLGLEPMSVVRAEIHRKIDGLSKGA